MTDSATAGGSGVDGDAPTHYDHGREVREERRSRVIGTNRAFRAVKAQQSSTFTRTEIIANGLTRFASSTAFLLFHFAWFAAWIAWNTGQFGLRAFDPFPFGLLTMVVSLEAIFLSIF